MRKSAIILGIAVLILAFTVGWQIGGAEIANMNLQEDIRDLSSQAGTHWGAHPPTSDEEIRDIVILKAKEHGIELSPSQVTVERTNPGAHSALYVEADYTQPVNLGVVSFRLHFTPWGGTRGN